MSNHQAIIAKVTELIVIPNADKVQIARVLGENVVVSKSVEVGDIGVFFPEGSQLSFEYCHNNNLHRNSELNSNTEYKGFFDTNRKVRAQPFLKVKSEAYFAGLESLSFAGDTSTLKVGDKFEDFNGVHICKKFYSEKALKAKGNSETKAKKPSLTPFFKEHVETGQFKHNTHLLKKGDLISIQTKKHGTSFRSSYTKVLTQLPKWKETINKFIKIFPTESYEYVTGTRRVVLDSPTKEGFHGSEGYRFEVTETLKPYLQKGMTIYGEIVGFVNGKPIMSTHSTKELKDKAVNKKYGDTITYKYGCQEGQYKFHIYRITLTTEDGTTIDFTQQQLVQWCKDHDLSPSVDLVEQFVYDGDIEKLSALVDTLTERDEVLTEDFEDVSHISEGVIIRVDRETLVPLFLKSKSYFFKVMEGISTEKEVDVEDIS